MGIVETATNPWGQTVPIHIAFYLIWVSAIGGLAFLMVHAIYVQFIAQQGSACGTRGDRSGGERSRESRPAQPGCAAVPLDHGGGDVRAFDHGVSAQGGVSVPLGDVSLDRRAGADRVHHFPHHPRVLLDGLLVHLAG